jgi:uncharacterized surface protein with fasciclin (FAS1) repeats
MAYPSYQIPAQSVHEIVSAALAAAMKAPEPAGPSIDPSQSLTSLLEARSASRASTMKNDKMAASKMFAGVSAKVPEVAAFMKLISNSAIGEAIASAPAGTDVTIFAPSNAAMKALPNNLNAKFAETEMADYRELFASQHVVFKPVEQAASSRNGVKLGTAARNKTLMYRKGTNGELMASMQNTTSDMAASASILETYQNHQTGLTVHVMSDALMD